MNEEKIKELEAKKFYLSMKDHWDEKDYERDRELNAQIIALKKVAGR